MNNLLNIFINNILFSILLGMLFFIFLKKNKKSIFFFIIGTLSTIYSFYFLTGMVGLIFEKFNFDNTAIFILGITSFILNLLLIVDFFIYKIYKFHINGMVLNIFFSPSAWKNVHLGKGPIFGAIFILFSLLYLEYILFLKIPIVQINIEFYSLLGYMLLIIFIEKMINGFCNIFNVISANSSVRVIPFYQRTSMRHFQRRFLKNLDKTRDINMKTKHSNLKYPIKNLSFLENYEKKDIYIFVLDAVRNDFITSEIAPNIYNFSENNIRFNKHFSGGAATRYGLFSLFYGLNGIYWHSFLAEQKGSLLFDVLKKRDYKNILISSSTLSWPEFRKTSFVDVNDDIKDDFKGEIWEKDRDASELFIKKIKQIPKDKNVFSFVFFDAPHGPYSYPKDFNKFKPDNNGKINYINVSEKNKDIYRNQYFNAINYDDYLVGKMMKALKETGRYNDSIIIIMSDHGEEFFECGNFGHNNAYTDEQTNSFLTIKYNDTRLIKNNMTSNVDIIPFLFSALGVKNNPDDYSNGSNIMNVNRDHVFLSKWSECAIKTYDHTFVFPFKAYEAGKLEVRRNKDYSSVNKDIINDNYDKVMKEMDNNSRFYV